MSDISSLVEGLSKGINGYLGMQLQTQQKEAETAQQMKLQYGLKDYEGQLNLSNAEKLASFKSGLKDPNQPTKADLQADKWEKDYMDHLQKVLSNRSGGLGLQDSKVNQAYDLRTLLNQYYDPKSKTYNVPPAQHSELALGLARLLSPSGTVPIELEKQLRQSTGREALANALIYSGADPKSVGGPTQSVIKMFRDSIDRQGSTAEKLRNKYFSDISGLYKAKVKPDRFKEISSQNIGNSFNEILSKSPDQGDNGPATSPKSDPLGLFK